jgi:type I restriction enzyme S subunit
MNPWPQVSLGEVLVANERAERVQPLREYRLLGVRLDGQGPFLREIKLGTQISASTLHRVEAEDFIYSRLFAWRGAFGVIPPEMDGCYVSGEFPTFRPIAGKADVEFVRLWFRLGDTLDRVLADCTGSTPLTRNRFKEEFFLRLRIPLPPLPEQRRIVARIEELAGKVGEARRGALEAGESAASLWGSFSGAMFGALSDQPTTRVEDVSTAVTKGTTPGTYGYDFVEEGVPFLRVEEVGNGYVNWRGSPFRLGPEANQFMARSRTQPGDVLVTIAGTIGRSAVVPQDAPQLNMNQAVALVRPTEAVLPTYLSHFFRSPMGQEQMTRATVTTAISNISLATIRRLRVPLPSAGTQRKIVAELDALQAKVDELKRLQAETQAELDALLPSILDRAFKGEL